MKVLIEFDDGFLARIERERFVAQNTTGKRPARTAMVRRLLIEAMDNRCQARGEEIPRLEELGVVRTDGSQTVLELPSVLTPVEITEGRE